MIEHRLCAGAELTELQRCSRNKTDLGPALAGTGIDQMFTQEIQDEDHGHGLGGEGSGGEAEHLCVV